MKFFWAEPSNDAERQSLEHLGKFVKSLEGKALNKFLQFSTGSDVITTDGIKMSFSSPEGLRWPVARRSALQAAPFLVAMVSEKNIWWPTDCKGNLLRKLTDVGVTYANDMKCCQVSYDPCSYECDLVIPVQCSNQLSYKATDIRSWSFVGSNEPCEKWMWSIWNVSKWLKFPSIKFNKAHFIFFL